MIGTPMAKARAVASYIAKSTQYTLILQYNGSNSELIEVTTKGFYILFVATKRQPLT